MSNHLRYAGADPATQEQALREIIAQSPALMDRLTRARDWNLPDWWIVSGAIYNTVWNHLTGRPDMYGVKDVDLFYFDSDRSYDAEDRLIREAITRFPGFPPVELRNQAIDLFASRTHCVGARLSDAGLDLYAPYGLDDIFGFRLTPNPALDNQATHHAKAVRQMAMWPELTIVPWPES